MSTTLPGGHGTSTGEAASRSSSASQSVVRRTAAALEESVAAVALAAMALLLLVESFVRPWSGFAIPGSLLFVRQLTLWVALLGGALAAGRGRLLALATGVFLRDPRTRHAAEAIATATGAAVAAILCVAAVGLVHGEYLYGTIVAAGLRAWVSQLALPIGFGLIAIRMVARVASPAGLALAAVGLVVGVAIALRPEVLAGAPVWPLVCLMIAAGALGAPLFSVLGGLAVLLFMADGTSPIAVLVRAYELTTDATLPALPVFTLAGFLLAEGDTAARLLRMFRAFFGWLPGGTAIVCAVVCAFFTVFTGGSGVTILALGGLLLPALVRDGYRDRFSIGLLTSSGSLGLLLPPALPLILYGIISETPIQQLFVGGILPGLVMIAVVAAYGMWEGSASGVPRARFDGREALASLWHGRWEFLLPIVVLGAFLTGYATILETSALTALYAFVMQVMIHRNINTLSQVRRVLADTVMTIGGVLIILAVAVGFT
ncbi:MAG TPA: TRAP transporter large permease subunit, partial [Vicinamibacterales bacterium]|nr:TRAP transporter large permease subunit [Vicinamibacterales bacterium]